MGVGEAASTKSFARLAVPQTQASWDFPFFSFADKTDGSVLSTPDSFLPELHLAYATVGARSV